MLTQIQCYQLRCTSLRGLGGVDTDPMLSSVLSSNVAGMVMFSSTTMTGASGFGFLGGRPGLRPDLGCDNNQTDATEMKPSTQTQNTFYHSSDHTTVKVNSFSNGRTDR